MILLNDANISSILSVILFCSDKGGRNIGIAKYFSKMRLCNPVVCVCICLMTPCLYFASMV